MASPWTETEINALVKTKEAFPHSSWERIAQKIGNHHSPGACRRKYAPFAPKLPTPWTLPQRRQLAKMIYYEPPTTWDAIAERVNHPSDECELFYNHHVTFKELARGKREAQNEQKRMQRHPTSVIVVSSLPQTKSSTTAQQEKGKSVASLAKTSAEKPIDVVATTVTTTATTTKTTTEAGTKRRFWTEHEIDVLCKMHAEGHDWKDIAPHVNRTPGACQAKWRRLH